MERDRMIRFAKDGWMNPFGTDELMKKMNGWRDSRDYRIGFDALSFYRRLKQGQLPPEAVRE
jgi:hypothetical protein